MECISCNPIWNAESWNVAPLNVTHTDGLFRPGDTLCLRIESNSFHSAELHFLHALWHKSVAEVLNFPLFMFDPGRTYI